MTRLATIPKPTATYTPNPEKEALVAELRHLRATLSLCAGRMACTRASVLAEVGRVEEVVAGLRELANRI